MRCEFALDGEILLKSCSRSLPNDITQWSCNIVFERSIDKPITRQTQLASVVLSETTTKPVKFWTGIFDSYNVTSKANGTIDEYNCTLKSILEFEDNELIKPQSFKSYFGNIALSLIEQSGASDPDRPLKLFRTFFVTDDLNPGDAMPIDVNPDTGIINFVVRQTETLSSCLQRLCDQDEWDLYVLEPGWLSIEGLGNSPFGAIAGLVFVKRGKRAIMAPNPIMTINPLSPCGWWEGQINGGIKFPTRNSILVIGKGGERVIEFSKGFTEPLDIAVVSPQVVYSLPDLTAKITQTATFIYPD